MDAIKNYLRTSEKFEKAYNELKELYREKVNFACDTLTLVEKGSPVLDENGYGLLVKIEEDFGLMACENGTMMIVESPTFHW